MLNSFSDKQNELTKLFANTHWFFEGISILGKERKKHI